MDKHIYACGLTCCRCLCSATDRNTLNHIFLCGGIGHWMWKHLAGITPAAPGFAKVAIAPRIHDTVGPRSVGGQFLSVKGLITSSWRVTRPDTVRLSVSLPIGVGGATILVPKPTTAGQPATGASIALNGKKIWDGTKLVGATEGILSAKDQQNGVEFTTTNGKFEFVSTSETDGRVGLGE